MLDALELPTFEKLVGQEFEMQRADGTSASLKLAEAHKTGERSAEQAADLGKRLPFSLVFSGPPELLLGQGMCTLRHPELGELGVFLVQLEQTADGTMFEAVFT